MKKTVSVSIASTPFILEEDAHDALASYLAGVRGHFAGTPEEAEIVTDIEARIAEQFLETGKQVITLQEVSTVIASMGDAREFGDAGVPPKDAPAPTAAEPSKKLYRNPDDVVIAGVCSGLAAYLGVDVTMVRVAFIGMALFNGFGIMLYLALWLVMPEAKTASQRLAMSGTPVNVETIKERVKERVEEVGRKDGVFRRAMSLPFSVLHGIAGFFSNAIFPLFRVLVGLGIAGFAVLLLLGASVALGIGVTNVGNPNLGIPLTVISPLPMILFTGIAAYLAVAIPLVFLFALGVALLTRKQVLRGTAAAGLLATWFLAIVTGAVSGVSIGTRVADHVATSPEFQETTREVPVTPFTAIRAADGMRVTFVQREAFTVTLNGRAMDIQDARVEVKEGVLLLQPPERRGPCLFCDWRSPRVTVAAPGLTAIEGEDGARFDVEKFHTETNLRISLSNGAYGKFDIEAAELVAELENSSRVAMAGKVGILNLRANNASVVDAIDLVSDTATVAIKNSSRADVGPSQTLHAQAHDSSIIRYAGEPELTEQTSDASRIERLGEDEADY